MSHTETPLAPTSPARDEVPTAGDTLTSGRESGDGLPVWPEEPPFIARARRRARERYRSLPMPTRKSEEWRYTDLSQLNPDVFVLPDPGATAAVQTVEQLPEAVRTIIEKQGERSGIIVERDGVAVFRRLEAAAEERGVIYAPLADFAARHGDLLEPHLFRSDIAPMEEKLWSLHVATLGAGYVLYVPKGVRLPDAFHAFHYVDRPGVLLSTHTLLVAEPGSEVTVIDEFVSPDLDAPVLSLGGVEIFGQDEATVRYLSLQRYGKGVRHFSMQHATSRRGTRLSGCNVTLGGDLSRADVTSHLEGPESDSEMLAMWFGDRDQHFDHHTLQHHAKDHAHSDLLYKGALSDAARSVFRGLIRVDKGAQLTDAYQTNRNLLLSEDSHATTLPNLEIEADDVRCSHGATVGQVDEGQLFYLMSRGLSRLQAERLLVFGFFDEVLKRIPVEGVRKRIGQAIEEKIGL